MTADRWRPAQPHVMLLATVAVLIGLGWWLLTRQTRDALVVYCAHDLMYAEGVLRDFERETGIRVVIVGDTEATKSLGLVQRLIREKDAPVCDVFWNNQMLGTVELARQGVLEPYQGKHWNDIPARFRDDDGLWTGFGGRLRVWIINTQFPPPASANLESLLSEESLNWLAIAQPMFGTTLSHYTVLWHQLGADNLKRLQHQLVEKGARFVPGNATVKDLVAQGACTLGMTDTDDYFQAVDAGLPVRMEPIRVADEQTICIPNTVAVIRGTGRRWQAERLVDFLTSPQNELRMARSASRQIPLGEVDPAELPDDVKPLAAWAVDSVDLKGLADDRSECLSWLTQEFAP